MEPTRVVVIGGGLAGIASALAIKSRSPGFQVTLLEKNEAVALENSFQSHSLQSRSLSSVWPRPGAFSLVLKSWWLGDPSLVVELSSLLSLQFVQWGFRFLLNCRPQPSEALSDSLFRLASRNSQLEDLLRAEEPSFKALQSDRPLLSVYRSRLQLEQAKLRAAHWNTTYNEGFNVLFTRGNCLKVEPHLNQISGEVAGCIQNRAEKGVNSDVYKYTLALTTIALARGVQLMCNAEVQSFTKQGDRLTSLWLKDGREIQADYFVVCAGQRSATLTSELGWIAPVWHIKTSTLAVALESPFKHCLHIADSHEVVLNSSSRRTIIGTTVEFTSDRTHNVSPQQREALLSLLQTNTNLRPGAELSAWANQLTVSVDDLPIVGRLPNCENVIVNLAHGNRSQLLALACGELVADSLLGHSSIVPGSLFSPSRFT